MSARVSKIRRARMIEGVPPVLWSLLRPEAKSAGRVMPGDLGHDVFRHTFAKNANVFLSFAVECQD